MEQPDSLWLALIEAVKDGNLLTISVLCVMAFLLASLATGNGANVFKLLGNLGTWLGKIISGFVKKTHPAILDIPAMRKTYIYKMPEIFALSEYQSKQIAESVQAHLDNIRKTSHTPVHIILDLSETETVSGNGEDLINTMIADVTKANVLHLSLVFATKPAKLMVAFKKKLVDLKSHQPEASWTILDTKAILWGAE